jgi:hypothetical protein
MKIFRVLTGRELRQAPSHARLQVAFAEMEGGEMGHGFHDPLRSTANRPLDSIPNGDPDGGCWIKGEAGTEPVVGTLIDPEGVRLLLDRARAKPFDGPKPSSSVDHDPGIDRLGGER